MATAVQRTREKKRKDGESKKWVTSGQKPHKIEINYGGI